MAASKKPGLALVIGESKAPKASDSDTDMGNDEDAEGYSASVDELFDALKNDDREGFADAFKAAVMSCK